VTAGRNRRVSWSVLPFKIQHEAIGGARKPRWSRDSAFEQTAREPYAMATRSGAPPRPKGIDMPSGALWEKDGHGNIVVSR
jgi:hypothetical protein